MGSSTREGPQEAYGEVSERLAGTYERTARVLEQSAALAERHAERQQRAGRSEAAADEHRTAAWAREAACGLAKQPIVLARLHSEFANDPYRQHRSRSRRTATRRLLRASRTHTDAPGRCRSGGLPD